MIKRSIFFALSAALLPLCADTVVPQKASDLRITIYNDNLAFVHDQRKTKVGQGKQRLIYEGVAHSLISASVIPTFEGLPVRLYSQNYLYDLISLPSMMRHSIGKKVSFYTNGKNPTLLEGTLLAYQPSVMVRQGSKGKIYTLEKASQLLFSHIPKEMIPRPSLVWEIETPQAGDLNIDLKYLTRGMSWKSDYVLNLHEKSLDLVGWITVNNRSGVSYPNARLTFLAGDVHQNRENSDRILLKSMRSAFKAPKVQEEAFAGYHIYKIPFLTTLANKQQKQIRFLERSEIPCLRYAKAILQYFDTPGIQKMKFEQIVEFENSQSNHLGVPLPQGTVRMYSKDREQEAHFIGESRIENTPAGEKIKLTVGTLFDATGERKITKYIARKNYRNVGILYTLHNRGEEPLTLKIEERIPRYGASIKLQSDCKGICSVKKLSAFIREFTIRLEGKKSYSFHSEFEVFE